MRSLCLSGSRSRNVLTVAKALPVLMMPLAAMGAGHTESSDEAFILTPVVVSARVSHDPISVEIDPRAPAQPIPAQDGADVLGGIAGFNIVRKGGTHGDPVFRGMAGSRIGIVLDGENTLGGCSNRMDPPTAYVFPSTYDKVTVVKGPQSVTHGAGYSAGIVLFERAPQRYEAPSASFTGSATVGSWGRNDQFAELRGGNPTAYYEVAGNRTASDDYTDGGGEKVHSHYERWSTRVALGWTPDANTLVELTSAYGDGEAAYADRMMDGALFERKNLGMKARRTGLSGLLRSAEASLYVNYVDHVMDNFSLREFVPSAMMPNPSASNPDRLTVGSKVQVKLVPWANVRSTVGTDQHYNRHRIRSTANTNAQRLENLARATDATFNVIGVFTENTVELNAANRIVTGVRVDMWSVKDHRATVQNGMMGNLANPTSGEKRRDTLPSGFLRFEHECCSDLTWFAGIGQTRRFPDYWELFAKETPDSLSAFRTQPEVTTQVDVGLTRRIRKSITASASLFANDIRDLPLIQTGFMKPSGMMGSRSATVVREVETRAIGGEAALEWKFFPGFLANASVSCVRATNQTDNRPLAQQPPHEGRIGISYSTTRWSVGTLIRAVDSQRRVAPNQGNIIGQDLGPSEGFVVCSVNAAWKPTEAAQVSMGIDNLGDVSYAEHLSRGGSMVAGYPAPSTRVQEPGRSAWVKLDVKF